MQKRKQTESDVFCQLGTSITGDRKVQSREREKEKEVK